MQLTRRDLLKSGAIIAIPLLGGKISLIPEVKPEPPVHAVNLAETLYQERQHRRQALVEKWSRFMEGVDPSYQPDLAQLLENQLTFGENVKKIFPNTELARSQTDMLAATASIFTKSPIHKLFDVQALDKRADFIFFQGPNGMEMEGVVCQRTGLNAVWSYEAINDLKFVHGIDAHAELLNLLTEEIACDLVKRSIREVANVAIKRNCYTRDVVSIAEWELSDIHRRIKTDNAQNWIITSPEIAHSFEIDMGGRWIRKNEHPAFSYRCDELGVFQFKSGIKCTIFVNPSRNTMLLGCKQPLNGCIFSPYVGLEISPVYMDPDAFVPRRKLQSFFTQKIINHNYYTLIYC